LVTHKTVAVVDETAFVSFTPPPGLLAFSLLGRVDIIGAGN